ncbi:MAG: FUSC family membrane protein [Sediminibacterium sp.]
MDYLKQYRSFINSHYLSEGVRMTAGILLPVLVLGYYGQLETGMAIALGALAVSIADNPGPIHHRKNGLIICNIILFTVALITGLTLPVHWLFFVVLVVCCFFFSMIGVYGIRASYIGIAALLIMVLQMDRHFEGWALLYNSLYILGGGCWYMLLSLVLYSIRPYKLMQQALGEYVMTTAEYLRAKAAFYDGESGYDKSYQQLLAKQIAVQEMQNLVAELIFKTRGIVKESTHTGRVLMMVFLDVADLFERAMTSHQDYEKLNRYFKETGILAEFRHLILALSDELDEIGIALKSGRPSGYDRHIDEELLEEREHLQKLRLTILNPANLEGFISLRHILDSIDDIAGRIRTLHHYTSYDRKLRRKKILAPDPEDFISHEEIDPKLIRDNLGFRSNIFRHSLRITLAASFAYLIAQFLPVGHSYWILLTVIVILKPGYSLTRQRNFARLAGTLAGAALGVLVLYLVKDKTALVVILGFGMTGAYSFMRKHYLVSVMLMTLYLLLMFHLLYPQDFNMIFTDRIIDTVIGSVIALLFGYLLAPVWEHEQISELMKTTLQDNMDYYQGTATVFAGKPLNRALNNVARKNSWVSLANLSDAFTRMLSEPRSKQKNSNYIHQFVVANHMLVSHIATLSYYSDSLDPQYIMEDYLPLIDASTLNLQSALGNINGNTGGATALPVKDKEDMRLLDQRINALMRQRQEELKQGQMETKTREVLSQFKSITDQFYFIYNVSFDIQKISAKLGE